MIEAKIVADSSCNGHRLTSMVVTMPRFILAELNTHRMLSRNSASSRAIPLKKMVDSVQNNPFIPIAWQKDHSGMQGTEYLTNPSFIEEANRVWLDGRIYAVECASRLAIEHKLTKQLANRLLEPFMYHTVLISASEWENFFALRCPLYRIVGKKGEPYNPEFDFRSRKNLEKELGAPDIVVEAREKNTNEDLAWLSLNEGQAEIHMMALAEAMWDARNESTPKELQPGEWHIPFEDKIQYSVQDGEYTTYLPETLVKIATAMCARVSYTVVGEEGKVPNYQNDIKLHDRLATSGHWSPFEHCAKAMSKDEFEMHYSGKSSYLKAAEGIFPYEAYGWSGNFRGFIQYRKTFNNENITT